MDYWTGVGGRLFLACVMLAFGLVGPARFAKAQSIDQLTDVRVEIASPFAISDDGSQVFTAASIDPDGGNPLNKFQLYSIDPVTATSTRLSDFARGDISQLASGGPGQTDLGALTCVENDSMDLDTLGSEDSVDPVPREGFFYLWRMDSGLNVRQGS